MRALRAFCASLPCLFTVMFATGQARAQDASASAGSCSGTTNQGTEVVTLGTTGEPARMVLKGSTWTDVTDDRRPDNLNPWGINFSDCTAGMRLDFSLSISGFAAGDADHVEAWAGADVDCSIDANRNNQSAGVSHPCWQIAVFSPTQEVGTSPITLPMSVYAWDVLRYEQPPQAVGQKFDPNYHANQSNGAQACSVQPTDAPVPINLYFLAVNSENQARGQPACYALGTDLVGPPPPPQVTVQSGDTLLTVYWTSPGNDADIAGYDVWSDPPAGGAQSSNSSAGSCGCSIAPGAQASDEESEEQDEPASGPFVADAADEASLESGAPDAETDAEHDGATDAAADSGPPDAAVDASRDGSADAAVDGSAEGGTSGTDAAVCSSPALTEHSTPASSSMGGISQIDPTYHAQSVAGSTPPSSSSPTTLTGMTNGKTYAVVVTTSDNFANDGPASLPSCAQPQRVNDFWGAYESDNGSAATCAFEEGRGGPGTPVIEALLLGTAAALVRRRRRR